jgi:hypothetical protein
LFPGNHSALLPTHQYSSLETLILWSGIGNVFKLIFKRQFFELKF